MLPELLGTPAETHTWRHLLSMTRGAETGGAWDVDEITALPGGQVAHIAAAPQRSPPGRVFAYDNGGSHLIAAAATRLLGEPVSEYADRVLLAPLGIRSPIWQCDPDGIPFGYGHLRLAARDLARLGQLWLDRGAPLVDPAFFAEMTRPQSAGGPPENLPYGFLIWPDEGVVVAGGWPDSTWWSCRRRPPSWWSPAIHASIRVHRHATSCRRTGGQLSTSSDGTCSRCWSGTEAGGYRTGSPSPGNPCAVCSRWLSTPARSAGSSASSLCTSSGSHA